MTIVGGYHQPGVYPVRLVVTDAAGVTGTTVCQICVHWPPHCPWPFAYPSADPSAHYIGWLDVPVTLDGSKSWDPNGDPLTYAWDLDGDGVFDDATGVKPQWTWHSEGTYAIGLMVTDQPQPPFTPCAETAYATVVVGNHAPVANPGGPYQAVPGQCVTLDGTGSSDPDPGDTISYAWDMKCLGQFTDSTAPRPQFCVPNDAPIGTVYCVSLKVTDSHGKYNTASTTVTAAAVTRDSFGFYIFDVGTLKPIVNGCPQYLCIDVALKGLVDAGGNKIKDSVTGCQKMEYDWTNSNFMWRKINAYFIQSVTLEKMHCMRKGACSLLWKNDYIRQQGKEYDTSEINLCWPLLYETECTKWVLSIVYQTSPATPDPGGRSARIHKERYVWTVDWKAADFSDFRTRLIYFAGVPAGQCELFVVPPVKLKQILGVLDGSGCAEFNTYEPGRW